MGNDLAPTVPPEVGERQAKQMPHEIRSQHIDGACAGTREEIATQNGQARRRQRQHAEGGKYRRQQLQLAFGRDVVNECLGEQRDGDPRGHGTSNEAAMAPACARQWGRK